MKKKPRVLLLSATSGAGHVRAAQALEKAFSARGDCVVEHIDALQHVSRLFQRIYDKAHISMVRRDWHGGEMQPATGAGRVRRLPSQKMPPAVRLKEARRGTQAAGCANHTENESRCDAIHC